MKRRELDFRNANEVVNEISLLRQRGYDRAGRWSLTQICQHLAATMKGGIEGFGFRLPWIVRATVGKWAFRFLLNRRKLGAGAPTFKILKPTHDTSAEDDDALIDDCIEWCRRAEQFEGPIRDYPLMNEVSVEDWRDFMWIHAAHHLGFLIPRDET